MNEQIASVIRTILKVGGAYLVAKGWTDTPGVESLIGGIITAIGIVWSAVAHKQPPAA